MQIAIIANSARTLLETRRELLTTLVDRGHTVHVLTPMPTPEEVAQMEDLGLEHAVTPMSTAIIAPLADMANLLHLKQVLFRIKPDMVLSTGLRPVVLGSLAARMAWVGHKKTVHAIIADLDFAKKRGILRPLRAAVGKSMYRAGLRSCDTVILKSWEDKVFFERLKVIPDHATTAVAATDAELLALLPDL